MSRFSTLFVSTITLEYLRGWRKLLNDNQVYDANRYNKKQKHALYKQYQLAINQVCP